jgi:beta-lactamase class A
VRSALTGTSGVSWSVMIRDGNGEAIAEMDADRPLSTASIGKLLLLIEVARHLELGVLDHNAVLRRRDDLMVADSGLWQHLTCNELSIADLAVLVASVSDNLATNVLLDHIGLAAVAELGVGLELTHTGLHDFVRDHRRPEHPEQLSTGSAAELSRLMVDLGRGRVVAPGVSDQVLRWLVTSVDLSMVASGFGLDPLAHHQPDHGVMLWNKTGTNIGVRADTGLVQTPGSQLGYAVIANWDPQESDRRGDVLDAMHRVGVVLRSSSVARA